VELKNIQVIASQDRNQLMLITCDPFYFVGGAPKRFIVPATFRGPSLRSHSEG
jgi:sortase (surface protein transpeptidase)